VARQPHRFDEFTEEEIEKLVTSLESLQEGELGVSMLVACGQKAVPPLRRYLLEGRPRVVYQPRQRAVRALAELRAKDVLLDYLAVPKETLAPEIRYAEEAVESTAARLLSQWHTEDVFQKLLNLASRRTVVGAIETLGEFRRIDALPVFIRLLGDDVGRTFAADAIRKLGSDATADLIEAAITPDPNRPEESPSSLVRRRQALRLLWDLGSHGGEHQLSKLKALLYDPDPEIAAWAAQMFLRAGDAEEQTYAATVLLNVYGLTNWSIQAEIQQTLQSRLEIVRPIAQRREKERLSCSEALLIRSLIYCGNPEHRHD
jgi:hypothetical protein